MPIRMVDNDSMFNELPQKDNDVLLVSVTLRTVIIAKKLRLMETGIGSSQHRAEESPIKDILAIK